MQAILTDIRVRGHKLELTVDGLGSFFVTDHLHRFTLKRVSAEDANWAMNEISRRPALAGLETRVVDSFFDAVQVDAPMDVAQSRCFPLGQVKQHLLHHPDTEEDHAFIEAMFNYLIKTPPKGNKPYTIERVRKHLYAHEKVRVRHHARIDRILRVLEDGWPIYGEPDDSPKVRINSPLPEQFVRGKYSTYARKTIAPKRSIVELDDSLVEEIKSGKKEITLDGRLRYIRMPTAEELRQESAAMVDIEIPLFRTDTPEVSWAAMVLYKNGITDRVIYTLHDVPGVVNGYRTVRCSNENDLAARLTEDMKQAGATTFVAYNVPFDAIKLREAGSFSPGEDDEEPKKISSIPFFERIGIKGMNVRDLLSEAKRKFDYLPNRKLVVVAQHVLGEDVFRKVIDYDQMEELELVLKGNPPQRNDVRAMIARSPPGEIIASYVSEDAEVMARLIESETFQHSLEDIAFISQWSRIDPYLLLHDPKRIQIFLERKYFETVGAYKDAVYPRFATFIKYEMEVKDKLRRVVEKKLADGDNGLVRNVQQAYLPLGRVLRQDVQWFFPEVKELYQYIDRFRGDSQRSYYLTRFEDALTEWMWRDYAAYEFEKSKLDKMTQKLDEREFSIACVSVATQLRLNGLERKLNKGTIAQKDLRPHSSGRMVDYMCDNGLSLQQFHKLFAQWNRVRKRNSILFASYEAGWDTYEPRLENFCTEVKEYCAEKGLTIVHVQGRYVYLTGNSDALFDENCPVITVDEIPIAYIAEGKMYYERHGVIPGFKRKDQPTHNLNIFEMDTFGGFLDGILSENFSDALTSIWEGLDTLGCQNVLQRDLVWFTKSTGQFRAYEDGGEIYFDEEKGFGPDWKKYEKRVIQRAVGLVKPLLGKHSRQFVKDALRSKPQKPFEFYAEIAQQQYDLF